MTLLRGADERGLLIVTGLGLVLFGCADRQKPSTPVVASSAALSDGAVYFQDFEEDDDGLWSPDFTRFEVDAEGNENISAGPFFADDTATLTLGSLPGHNRVTLHFDSQIFGDWEGQAFNLMSDGNVVAATSFSNGEAQQAFPDQLGGAMHPAQTGAVSIDLVDLGYSAAPRAIYHQSYTFEHSGTDLVLGFAAPDVASSAAFGLDNVEVDVTTVEAPLCTDTSPELDDHNACTIDVCDPSVGIYHVPVAAGTSCSDGNACNGAEVCDDQGECLHGQRPPPDQLPPNDPTCDGIDDDCDGLLDEDYVPACSADGLSACVSGHVTVASCDDANACTTDSCSAGACVHDAISCDDHNSCTADSCDPLLGCLFAVDQSASCSDGDVCTLVDTCDATGTCVGSSPLDPDDGNPCTDDSCDPISGAQHVAAVGRACDDGNACTVSDACDTNGACVATTTRDCSDGSFCDGAEGCDPASGCTPGTPPALSDGIDCTLDSCDEATVSILHQPNNAACSDGNACDGAEICDVLLGCQAGTPVPTDDDIPCTVDSCDPVSGAVAHVPNDAFCDDHNACTSDRCDVAAGCQHADVSASCDDHDVCTGTESCDPANGCRPGTPLVSDDGNPCTADGCDPVLGVRHTALAIGSACGDDGHSCDGSGQCIVFTQCATNLVVGAGQNLSFSGPCQIDNISFNGGNLTVTGGLRTGAVNLASGGSLKVTNGVLIASSVTVATGSVNVDGNFGGVVRQSGGSLRVGGNLVVVQSADFLQSAGTFTNDGTISLPVFDASVVSGGRFVNRGELDVASNSITVAGGVTLSESGKLGSADSIGSLNVLANGKLTHEARYMPGVAFTVTGDASIAQNGLIDVSGLGLRGGQTANNDSNFGETFSADGTSVVNGSLGRSGGSHGGRGGVGTGGDPNELPSGSYDVASTPALLGSGGGSANSCCGGGNGGGRVDLVVLGALNLDGTIQADGQGGNGTWSGGGSGGALRLRVGTFAGAGVLSANGASGDGSGGGGRVAIEYAQKTYTGTVTTALGSGGIGPGAAGTVYFKDTTRGSAELVIDNGGLGTTTDISAADVAGLQLTVKGGVANLSGAAAPFALKLTGGTLNAGSVSVGQGGLAMSGGKFVGSGLVQLAAFDDVAVTGGTFVNLGELDLQNDSIVVGSGVTFSESGSLGHGDSIASLRVRSGGKVTHEVSYAPGLSFTVRGDLTVESGGAIDVTGKGLRGGLNSGNTASTGETYAADLRTIVAGSSGLAGGSYGGLGSTGNNVAGALVSGGYGIAESPVWLGSGGGSANSCCGGGNGGGRIDLVVKGTLRVDGTVRADGGNGNSTWAGGGAGGSVRLQLGNYSGAGSISASGGLGDGVGGGGRAALSYRFKDFSGTLVARGQAGGSTWGASSAGSVLERNLSSDPLSVTPALAAGDGTLCQLAASGSVACLGSDGAQLVSSAPIGGYARLVMGPDAACVLDAQGFAQCWGVTAPNALFAVPALAWNDVAVGASAACGVRQSDGQVMCWGDDSHGLVSAVPSGSFSAIAMSDDSACALRSAGTLACWGNDANHTVSQAPSATLVALDGGAGFFCGIDPTGNLLCWGDDAFGQSAPPAGTFASVSAGLHHACALDGADNATCWGDDSEGQANAPTGGFSELAAGDDFSCGLRADGTLACWGASL